MGATGIGDIRKSGARPRHMHAGAVAQALSHAF
jgi:hypothetical protein